MSFYRTTASGWGVMYNSPHPNSHSGWFIYLGDCSHGTRVKLQFGACKRDLVFLMPISGGHFKRLMGRDK